VLKNQVLTIRDYLGIYEENSRPFLLKSEQTDAYFLSNRGAGMSRQNFFYAVKSYAIFKDRAVKLF
jgi:integrase/recombinase XerD